MVKETLGGGGEGGNVTKIFNGLSKKQKNEMLHLLNQEKKRESLVENLDENNCCNILLEVIKSFEGSEITPGLEVINHRFFFPDAPFFFDRKQVHNLDKLTKDDIFLEVPVKTVPSSGKVQFTQVPFTLSEIENESEPLNIFKKYPNVAKETDKEIRDRAKSIIIKYLKKFFKNN